MIRILSFSCVKYIMLYAVLELLQYKNIIIDSIIMHLIIILNKTSRDSPYIIQRTEPDNNNYTSSSSQ